MSTMWLPKEVPSILSKCSVARFTYLNPRYSNGILQYAIRILAKSDKSHKEPKSIPAMLVITPKEITRRQRILIKVKKALLVEIRLAHISLKDKKPNRQVKAKSPKHKDTKSEIMV